MRVHPWLEFGCGSPLCTTMTKIHAFLTRSYACNSRTCLQGGRFYHRHSIIFPAGARFLSTIHYPLRLRLCRAGTNLWLTHKSLDIPPVSWSYNACTSMKPSLCLIHAFNPRSTSHRG